MQHPGSSLQHPSLFASGQQLAASSSSQCSSSHFLVSRWLLSLSRRQIRSGILGNRTVENLFRLEAGKMDVQDFGVYMSDPTALQGWDRQAKWMKGIRHTHGYTYSRAHTQT